MNRSAPIPVQPPRPPVKRPRCVWWHRLIAWSLLNPLWLWFPSWSLAAADIKPDESVIVFPAFAARAAESDQWTTELHVWVGELEPRGLALAALRKTLGLATDLDDGESAVFNDRARWFLADNERGKEVTVEVGGTRINVGPTDANGHAYRRVTFDAPRQEGRGESRSQTGIAEMTVTTPNVERSAPGGLYLVEPEGLSVISDIDDTIKITEVRDRQATLRNTFLRPFRPAPGMAPLYESWRTNQHAAFHYVSASPWQLYPALAEFGRTHGFPAGTFHLKALRLKDDSFLDLFQSPVEYKLGVIEPILTRFPQRRFVLVGDSGEADPEVYGEIARRHPGQIEQILIRNVSGEDEGAARYQAAFREVPPTKWQVFSEPENIRSR